MFINSCKGFLQQIYKVKKKCKIAWFMIIYILNWKAKELSRQKTYWSMKDFLLTDSFSINHRLLLFSASGIENRSKKDKKRIKRKKKKNIPTDRNKIRTKFLFFPSLCAEWKKKIRWKFDSPPVKMSLQFSATWKPAQRQQHPLLPYLPLLAHLLLLLLLLLLLHHHCRSPLLPPAAIGSGCKSGRFRLPNLKLFSAPSLSTKTEGKGKR